VPEILTRVLERYRLEADSDGRDMLWAATQMLMGLRYPVEEIESIAGGI